MNGDRIDQLLLVVVCWFINKRCFVYPILDQAETSTREEYSVEIGITTSTIVRQLHTDIPTCSLPGLNFTPVPRVHDRKLASPPISRVKEQMEYLATGNLNMDQSPIYRHS